MESAGDQTLRHQLFGFSGTNCHIVLEEAPVYTPKEQRSTKRLLLLSAMNQHVLRCLIQQYLEFDFSTVDLDDVCYTAACRDHYCCRLAIILHRQTT